MAHLLGGGLGSVQINLATINGGEEIEQGLNRLDARVFAAAVDKLPDEAQCNACVIGDGFEARCASLTKAALEVVRNGFDGGGHGS